MMLFDDRLDNMGDDSSVPQGSRPSCRPADHSADRDDDDQPTSRDIHHDPWLTPACPALQTLAATVFEDIEHNSPTPPRQRRDATERRRAITGNLIASLALLLLYHPAGTRLAISARNGPTTRYDRPRFSREVVTKLIGSMEALGLIIRQRGRRGNQRSTIEPTPRFRDLMAGLKLGTRPIGRAAGAETIILKAFTGRGRSKLLLDYADTPETIAMRADMTAINAFLREADIKLDGRPPPVPVLLTRRFQIEHPDAPHTFDQHGRLYGGFWMNLPKTQRHLLAVNGEEVADLDFTAMFPQLAYLEAGAALSQGDPYSGIEGLPRAAAKMGLSALLCRRGAMRRLPSEVREAAGKEWNAKRLSGALAQRHPAIASMFGTGLGLRLMFTESRILVEALRTLMERRVPALPMHDGIMVPRSKANQAVIAMIHASEEIAGARLPVVIKG
ncbi:hypothetical protein [Mesorhizobium sp. M0244]|uniref:hypothetical protein n=1 Tax=Mesorhizobium sp. M0244 TaxID=2956926 RepID=UPI00333B08BE